MAFDPDIRTTVLLWSDRHCCLCGKSCGINIEVHHIVPVANGGTEDIDNAIPLCFDCHGAAHHYDSSGPLGNKFKPEELKRRREQVYERYTRRLVPPVHYELTQALPDGGSRQLPDVGFVISHCGDSLPVKALVRVEPNEPGESLGLSAGYYTGQTPWHLNPPLQHFGPLHDSRALRQWRAVHSQAPSRHHRPVREEARPPDGRI